MTIDDDDHQQIVPSSEMTDHRDAACRSVDRQIQGAAAATVHSSFCFCSDLCLLLDTEEIFLFFVYFLILKKRKRKKGEEGRRRRPSDVEFASMDELMVPEEIADKRKSVQRDARADSLSLSLLP